MSKLAILLNKEWQESVKDYKIIWLPIFFIGLGITQPLMMMLLPQLLKSGGIDGMILDPNAKIPTGNEIYAGVWGQFNQLGILIIALLLMGCILKEKQMGLLDLLFSKPVSTVSYLASKYLFNSLLIIISFIIGSFVGVYYTNIYYSHVNWSLYTKSSLLFILWFLFIIALGVTASATAKTQIQSAAFTVIVPTLLLVLNNFTSPLFALFLPSYLSKNAVSIMTSEKLSNFWLGNVLITLIYILSLFFLSYWKLNKKGD